MKKVVLAFDSFKGSLSAAAACRIAADALHQVRPELEIVRCPMADGGEGTAEALQVALGGGWMRETVTGPLPGMRVEARWLWCPEKKLALVEMAEAAGLTLLRPEQRNPLHATTYGVGELLRSAVKHGADKILLAVGGSATCDGGLGAAAALGFRFKRADGSGLDVLAPQREGETLMEQVAAVVSSERLALPAVEVLCDVTNPLYGSQGAAFFYAPQKGASAAEVEQLDRALRHFAGIVEPVLNPGAAQQPGTGAAGGLAFGALVFMQAHLRSGIDAVMEAVGLRKALQGAAWVVTGEGRLDAQSVQGKVISGVQRLAAESGCRTAVLAGSADLDADALKKAGLDVLETLMRSGLSVEECIRRAPDLLEQRIVEFARRCL